MDDPCLGVLPGWKDVPQASWDGIIVCLERGRDFDSTVAVNKDKGTIEN